MKACIDLSLSLSLSMHPRFETERRRKMVSFIISSLKFSTNKATVYDFIREISVIVLDEIMDFERKEKVLFLFFFSFHREIKERK